MKYISNNKNTSWNKVSDWYGNLVGQKGHYYHQNVIIPGSLKLLNLNSKSKLLDIACGTGVFARFIPKNISYCGIDAAPALISQAKNFDKNVLHSFVVGDVTKDVALPKNDFTHAVCILALQNIKDPQKAIQFAKNHLATAGKLLIVLNHPCFRIPRQSSWGIDEKNKLQYRRIQRYLTPLEIPITMHPGQKETGITWSFHHAITDYSQYFFNEGFSIIKIEEWISDKESNGKVADMENRARAQFPLFLTFLVQKTK
jgi:ubiquinone/menaquinone biosynthesis C-methylase UbiE